MPQTPVGESPNSGFLCRSKFRASDYLKNFASRKDIDLQAVRESPPRRRDHHFAEEHGAASEQVRRRMKLLAPHFPRGADRQGTDLRRSRRRHSDALDGIAAGMWPCQRADRHLRPARRCWRRRR
jgi:hypothetical protein